MFILSSEHLNKCVSKWHFVKHLYFLKWKRSFQIASSHLLWEKNIAILGYIFRIFLFWSLTCSSVLFTFEKSVKSFLRITIMLPHIISLVNDISGVIFCIGKSRKPIESRIETAGDTNWCDIMFYLIKPAQYSVIMISQYTSLVNEISLLTPQDSVCSYICSMVPPSCY